MCDAPENPTSPIVSWRIPEPEKFGRLEGCLGLVLVPALVLFLGLIVYAVLG